MPIQLLPDEVASQIAAGEVVERPSSVIKELVENAIDAGANNISIKLLGSGQPLIEVNDNGSGIIPAELELAVARHATSKLKSAEDLFHIHTLGFRGEALASIGSISHLTISSQTASATTGAKILVEGGRVIGINEIAQIQGTNIKVEDLFYNVPARLKFLKKDVTEKQNNLGLLSRYALAYPKIRMKVIQDDKTLIQTSGSGDRREIIGNLFEAELARQMIEIEGSDYGIHIEGFISPISVTRSNRREITFFVNGRWVQDATLSSALLQAYHTYLMVGRYPMAVLFISIPPEDIDVNVHPAKAEVRFKTPDQVFSVIQRGVRKALLASSPVPNISTGAGFWPSIPIPARSPDPAWEMAGEATVIETFPQDTASIQPVETQPAYSTGIPLLRLIGQIGATYLVAEGPDGLYLIDQHAAHERVLYELFIRQKGQRLVSQQLIEPHSIQLSSTQAGLLETQLNALNHLGFDVEHFGGNMFLVRAIPALFGSINPESTLRVLVDEFEEDETPFEQEIEAKIIARVCKRAAVKAGQVLSPDEQKKLLSDLESCFSPRTCPHGRPTMIHLSVDLLERQFGRRGAR